MQKIKTMLIDPSNHFICLLIDHCLDGGGTTTQSCLASPSEQSKAKFDIAKWNKKIILGQKIKANTKIILGQRKYFKIKGKEHLQNQGKGTSSKSRENITSLKSKST